MITAIQTMACIYLAMISKSIWSSFFILVFLECLPCSLAVMILVKFASEMYAVISSSRTPSCKIPFHLPVLAVKIHNEQPSALKEEEKEGEFIGKC